jgi:AcrR family transcriptional regulator
MGGAAVTATARPRAKKQPAEVRRETVLDAAIRVFARLPYRSAGTAEIAREAGIAEPTIYRHFSSKRELYLAALDRTSDAICEAWQAIVDRHASAEETLAALGAWYFDSAVANPDPLRLRHRAAAEAEDDEVRERIRKGYGRIAAMLAEVIRRGQEQGAVAAEIDPAGAAWLFCGIGQMLDLTILSGVNPMDAPWCGAMGEIFNRGIRP